MKWKVIIMLTTCLLVTSCTSLTALEDKDPQIRAARNVIARQIGARARKIRLGLIKKENKCDVYEYEAKDGVLTLKGSSPVAITRAFHDYLKANKLGMVGWEGACLRLPVKWPTTKLKRTVTPFQFRQCDNACTAGYSQPYWDWKRWEQELDWRALRGFNMMMAPIATEAISLRVYQQLGLTVKELDKFYTGPAHLPWQRMGCIQGVTGTLDADWHKDQVALQQKVLKRMRELGMEPIVQGFNGFVPADIKRLYPDTKYLQTCWYAGFALKHRPVMVFPDQPLFAEITKMYMNEWKKEFGPAKYFLVDSFNELHLPKTKRPITEVLADFGKATYEALKGGDKDAVWTLQGWMLYYDRGTWTYDNVKAFFSNVPNGRMMVLDYANEYATSWDRLNGFFGKSWGMGFVPNMGGKTAYTGDLKKYASEVNRVFTHPKKGDIKLFSMSGEGIENNPVIYELTADAAWTKEKINLDKWMAEYCSARYGAYPESVKKSWDLLRATCYGELRGHPKFGWQTCRLGRGSMNRDPRFFEAVHQFLEAGNELKGSKMYKNDAVEMAAFVLGLKAEEWFEVAHNLLQRGDEMQADKCLERALELLLETDRLLESHCLNRLGRWVDFARKHGHSEEMKNYYESNAKRIVTVWGPPINTYACRMWSGVIRDYYAPRMQAFYNSLKGKPFNRRQWEEKWITTPGISKITPYSDPVAKATEMVKRACTEKLPKVKPAETFATWQPSIVSTQWQTVDWELPLSKLKGLKGVRFAYTKGGQRLEIKSVSLVADGNVVTTTTQNGYTGHSHSNNTYLLKLPKKINANNGAQIRAVIKGGGGTDSYGKVELLIK